MNLSTLSKIVFERFFVRYFKTQDDAFYSIFASGKHRGKRKRKNTSRKI